MSEQRIWMLLGVSVTLVTAGRVITGGCFRCGVEWEDALSRAVVVSPTGKAHFGGDYGVTRCGIDATGDKWWWPL